jgi:hypothetical protein
MPSHLPCGDLCPPFLFPSFHGGACVCVYACAFSFPSSVSTAGISNYHQIKNNE